MANMGCCYWECVMYFLQIDWPKEGIGEGEHTSRGEHAKPVVRRSQFDPKIMISVFFKSIGLVYIHF